MRSIFRFLSDSEAGCRTGKSGGVALSGNSVLGSLVWWRRWLCVCVCVCVCQSVLMEEREPVGSCVSARAAERERERESESEGAIWGGSKFLALGHRTYFHHPAVCTFSVSVEITLYTGHLNISRCTIYLFKIIYLICCCFFKLLLYSYKLRIYLSDFFFN